MKKRIVVLLTVVALMVGMLAMSVAPAFAATFDNWGCRYSPDRFFTYHQGITSIDRNGDGRTCEYYIYKTATYREADNNLHQLTP